MTPMLTRPIRLLQRADRALGRSSGGRRILVDAHTPVNVAIAAPIFRAMRRDPRVEFFWTSSQERDRLSSIYAESRNLKVIHPSRAALMRFDAYLASDFTWAWLPRGVCRIQIFHGVAGKYGFDAPNESMRHWDRLLFVNERRLRNFVQSGAIDAASSAIRLVGMPKTDCVVDGTFKRADVLGELGLDPARPTLLYAPTRSPESSLNAFGLDLVRLLQSLPINVVVKLHDRQRDPRVPYSGGVDWVAAIQPLLNDRTVLAPDSDISRYLVAADVMITDHSSAGFEFLLCDRPLVRIHRPSLIAKANIHPDYVALLASASESVVAPADAVAAVERALAAPGERSSRRQEVARDLFYRPGSATARAVKEVYEAIALEPLGVPAEAAQEVACPQSL
jgi:CDP-glycerol glycerophosphotransferase (TagB/SpsB family)